MRHMRVVAVLAGLLGAVLATVVTPAAHAQTGYPPGPCTTITGTQNVGSVNIGQRFVLQVAPTCLFTPGTPVTVTVNGVDIPGKTAEAGGFVLVEITVLSATELSINPIVPAICGTNTVVARGASTTAQGGVSTQTATFTLNCPAGTSPTVTGGTGQGLLSRTGSEAARYVAVALALMVAGAMALVVTRRRRTATV
jgi:hypothetical protein